MSREDTEEHGEKISELGAELRASAMKILSFTRDDARAV
jgi:hypothetical protein